MGKMLEAGKNSEKTKKPLNKKDPANDYPEDNKDKPSSHKDYEDLSAGEKKKVKTFVWLKKWHNIVHQKYENENKYPRYKHLLKIMIK
jgi:hypothetical protein